MRHPLRPSSTQRPLLYNALPFLHCPLLLFLLLHLFLITPTLSIRFYLNPHQRRCFTEDLGYERRMRTSLYVTDGKGSASINLLIRNPSLKTIYQKTSIDHGKFTWTTDPMPEELYKVSGDDGVDEEEFEALYGEQQRYEICVENLGRGVGEKRMVLLEMEEDWGFRGMKARKKDVDRAEKSLRKMEGLLRGIMGELGRLETRERKLVKITRRTNRRVVWSASVGVVVILMVAGWQYKYYKSYFTAKKLI